MSDRPGELVYRRMTADEAIEPIARLPGLAFGYATEATAEWLVDGVGRENMRVVERGGARVGERGGEAVACVGCVPMGIYLGGREVEQVGVLAVATGPEARGGGVARWMMDECVREMHAGGAPLSALYSAMHPLYRGVGYENAGVLCDAVIPAGMFTADRGSGGGWREATKEDQPALDACHRAYAMHRHGMLARRPYIWRRVWSAKQGLTRGFVAEDGAGGIEAYCFYVQGQMDGAGRPNGTAAGAEMSVSGLGWSTPRGFARLRAFLRGFSSIVGEIRVSLPPDSPLLMALPDRRWSLRVRETWMLRVLDVAGALEARGYPAGLTSEVVLDIEDGLIGANCGRWTLRVDGGEGRVRRGGEGEALRCDIRDFAAIYTGFVSPASMRMAGRAWCDDRVAEIAGAVFGGMGTPAMVDMF